MAQQRLTKFTAQAGVFTGRQITDRDIDIIKAIARYRFLPTPYVLKLLEGNERVTQRRLQILFHNGVINRFAWGRYKQAVYYLDDRDTLRLLQSHLKTDLPSQLFEEVDNNREKDYAGAVQRQEQGRLLFIDHELMISRMHFLLEMCSKAKDTKVKLSNWRQGAELWNRVEVPKLDFDRRQGIWVDGLATHWLPHRPDAFFSLKFLDRPEGQNLVHFLYEADRGTMTATDMKFKLRAHFHFVVKQKRHQHYYGVHPIRAVLVETNFNTLAAFLPPPNGTANARLSIYTGSATPPGSYQITIYGISGSLSHSVKVALTVNPAPLGTIQVFATLNGNSTWTGPVSCSLNGPAGRSIAYVPAFFSGIATGTYSIGCSNGPGTLVTISPASAQQLGAGQTTTFTLNFVQPQPPVISKYQWNTTPKNKVNFSGTISGANIVSGTQVFFCVNGSSTCYAQPAALVTVNNSNTLTVNNVNLPTGSWQIYLKDQYGPSLRSSAFYVNP